MTHTFSHRKIIATGYGKRGKERKGEREISGIKVREKTSESERQCERARMVLGKQEGGGREREPHTHTTSPAQSS